MGVKVTNRNGGVIKELIARLEHRMNVKVGVQGSDATKPHGPVTVVDIAAIHEFGLGNNPERSWLRAWFDENQGEATAKLRSGMQNVIAGKISIETLGRALGLWAQTSMQARIAAGISPGLAAETIARKESSTPLIDTGVFRSSITFVVETGEMFDSGVIV